MESPNLVAYAALVIWPLVAFGLYATRPLSPATIWTILGAYLLLPVGASIKFEGVPAFDKNSIPNLVALLACMLVTRRLPRVANGFGLAESLMLMLLIAPFITSALNTDAVTAGARVLPGVDAYDALSASVAQLIFLIPFILARQFLRSAEDTALILRTLVIAGLAYSLPMLFEVRMSPQLHTWIYGYFPHSFVQQIRDGGFRPVVFLGHGLTVAFFTMTTVVAAAALWRARARIGQFSSAVVTGYLGIVLLLCKTLGAFVYGALLAPLVRWGTPRMQIRVAVLLAGIALAYPILRTVDLVPTRAILDLAGMVSTERATSLDQRFDSEDALLQRALQRPWFGWGRYGRSRIYDEWTGQDISITDGGWIIVLGSFGIFGFIAQFGLLAWTVVRAASALRFAEPGRDRIYLAALALILAINMIDLLPNSTLSPWTWLLAGALLGRSESIRIAGQLRAVRLAPSHA